MKLLADAHISRAIRDFLIRSGHDCIHAELLQPGLSDEQVMALALGEERIVLTADKGFGELVFRRTVAAIGVILLRLHVPSEAERLALFCKHWPIVEQNVFGHFVVVTNRRVRRTPLPGAEPI